MMSTNTTKQVAAIANKFIQHARYKLTPREQKLILYMATLIKTEDSDFTTYMVPVSEIEYILKGDADKKHGSFYERLDDLLDSITDKKISFPTDFTLDGTRLRGHINWVAGAIPKLDKHGVLCVEFGFSPQMKPFLLGLKEKFTQFEIKEVAQMRSGFSIRIFQMCKAFYFENIRHGRNTIKVGIDEFKLRLGIGNKYPDFRNFRRKVLDVAKNEINANTRLQINYEYGRTGRKITNVSIIINEKKNLDILPNAVENPRKSSERLKEVDTQLEHLTEAKLRAFEMLLDYGVNKRIITEEIFPIIKGSEMMGYEDYFVQRMLLFFEEKTDRVKQGDKVKALVGWIRNKRFEAPNLYARLVEEVIEKKKYLKEDERQNRETAKLMSAQAFRKLYKEAKTSINTVQKKDPQKKTRKGSAAAVSEVAKSMRKTKAKARKKRKAPFDFETFKKEYHQQYKQIKSERTLAFEPFKATPSYRQLLDNSIAAYCEKWYLQQ